MDNTACNNMAGRNNRIFFKSTRLQDGDSFVSIKPVSSARFSGLYTPQGIEIAGIKEGLKGYPNQQSIIGPCHLPEQKVENAIYNSLINNQPVSDEIISSVAKSKARLMNFYAIYLNKAVIPVENYLAETKQFFAELKAQVEDIKTIFTKNCIGFRSQEIDLLSFFIAKTAPVLFVMGFPDAIKHSAQVTKLAVYKAKEMGGSRTELLQTAMAGWIHDPKYATHISEENLATHPIIASAVAEAIFEDPDFRGKLKTYLNNEHSSNSLENFIGGITEALSINDDSRFVNKKIIINRIIPAVKKVYGAYVAQELEKIIMERIKSSSAGEKPPVIPDNLLATLSDVKMETGLVGVCTELLDASEQTETAKLIDSIMNGATCDPETVMKLHKKLHNAGAFVKKVVNARSLFSHHEEVNRSGKLAALALINADPILLSPHKILAAIPACVSFIDKLKSFTDSLSDNFNDLPLKNQDSAKPWHRAIYVSVLNAADIITGNQRGLTASKITIKDDISQEIEQLKQLVINPSTWGITACLKADNPDECSGYEKALSTLENEYQRMIAGFRDAVFKNDGSLRTII